MEEIPCRHCVCVPICRHKKYSLLFRECGPLLEEIVGPHEMVDVRNGDAIIQIYDILRPTLWCLRFTGSYTMSDGSEHSITPSLFVENPADPTYSDSPTIFVEGHHTIKQLKKDWTNGKYTL